MIASFLHAKENEINKILSLARDKIANELKIIDKEKFAFCWIVDYPMYEFDENSKKLYSAITCSQCHKEISKN